MSELTRKRAEKYIGVNDGDLFTWECTREYEFTTTTRGNNTFYIKDELDAWIDQHHAAWKRRDADIKRCIEASQLMPGTDIEFIVFEVFQGEWHRSIRVPYFTFIRLAVRDGFAEAVEQVVKSPEKWERL